MNDDAPSGPGYGIVASRVAAWRRGHRNYASPVASYTVFHDGVTVATFPAGQSAEGLNEDLAAATWDVAQGLSRAVTVDLVAYDAGGAELARKALRVLPEAPPKTREEDLGGVVKVLLDAHRDSMQQQREMMTAVVSTLKEVAGITTELARATATRVKTAEESATQLRDALNEAMATAREVEGVGDLALKQRREEFLMDFLKEKVLGVGSNGAANGSTSNGAGS